MSFFRRVSFSVISVSAAFGLSAAKSQELVTNGTFAGCTGITCSGWTLQTNLTSTFLNGFSGNVFYNRYPFFISPGPTLSQNIATSIGKTYSIKYALRRSANVGTNYLFRSSFGGAVLANITSGLSTTLTAYSYTAKAISSSTSLEFYGYEDTPQSWELSNVSVTLLNTGLAYSSTLQPYADMQSIGLDALKNQRELVLNQAGDCDQKGWVVYDSNKTKTTSKTKKNQSLCVFAEGGYATGTINGADTLAGYSTGNASSAYGVEWKPSKQWAVGASYGYGTTSLSNFNFQDTTSYISSNINSGNVYGVYRPDKHWKIAALFGYSDFSYSGSRTYLGDTANAKYSASGYTAALQASYDIPLSRDYNNKKNPLSPVRLKPLVGLAWGANQQGSFSESGSGTLVNVQSQTTNSLMGTVGLGLEAPILLNRKKSMVLTPRVGAAYQYDFLANQAGNKSITANLQSDTTTSYTEAGQNRGANNAYLDLGADFQLNPQVALFASVNYQAFTNGDQFGYQGGVRVKF